MNRNEIVDVYARKSDVEAQAVLSMFGGDYCEKR